MPQTICLAQKFSSAQFVISPTSDDVGYAPITTRKDDSLEHILTMAQSKDPYHTDTTESPLSPSSSIDNVVTMASGGPRIGIFALQGAVSEHVDAVKKLGGSCVEIKYPEQIRSTEEPLDGIILPGGESTTMSIVGEQSGIFPALREWVLEKKKPVWGTCAGMILLSDHCVKTSAGQSLLGGLDAHVCRNFFGSQIYSTEMPLSVQGLEGDGSYPAIFIRAPAILSCGKDVQVLASINAVPHKFATEEVQSYLAAERELGAEVKEGEKGEIDVKVAIKSGNILATAFHPELSEDLRWHQYFLEMCR